MPRAALRAEALALLLAASCQRAGAPEEHTSIASPAPSLGAVLVPSAAGKFECEGETCTQPYPRLPDTGQWRCAEEDGVVWCAGGDPAAGVVPGTADASYRCGKRLGQESERICIDDRPDYPEGGADRYACRFAQERGIERVCQPRRAGAPRRMPADARPACWLDVDCPSGACARGVCRCSTDRDCDGGRCRRALCSEAAP